MNVRAALEANAKATKVMKPRVSPFDYPTEFAHATAMLGAPSGDDRLDAALSKAASMCLGIVTTIGVDDTGLAQRSATHTANRCDRIDER